MILIRHPWTRQPQFFAPVAKTELARGLEFAWSGIGDADVFGRATTKTGSGTIVVAPMGKVFSNARGQYLDTLQNYTATGSNRPITYAGWFAADNSDTSVDCLMSVGNLAANYSSFSVYGNVIAGGTIYVGTINADVYTAGSQFSAGQWVSLVVSFDGTGNFGTGTCRVWVNRQQKSTTFSGVPGTHNITQTPVRLMNERSASSRAFRGKVGPSGLWSRPWTQYDVDAWHANPWQLFEPRRIWVPVSAAGGGGAVGLATETNSALALSAKQITATGLAAETDTALALVAVQQTAVGLAAETDSALALAAVQATAVGLATETDTALALSAGAGTGVGLASETDTALALSAVQIQAVGLATETDSGLALSAISVRAAGLSLEIDTGLALSSVQIQATGLATETDSAFSLAPSGAYSILPPYIAVYFWKRTA